MRGGGRHAIFDIDIDAERYNARTYPLFPRVDFRIVYFDRVFARRASMCRESETSLNCSDRLNRDGLPRMQRAPPVGTASTPLPMAAIVSVPPGMIVRRLRCHRLRATPCTTSDTRYPVGDPCRSMIHVKTEIASTEKSPCETDTRNARAVQ